MVEQNLWSWPQNMSPPSLPRFLAFLKKATTFLPTFALDHWLLSSKQLNLSSGIDVVCSKVVNGKRQIGACKGDVVCIFMGR